MFLFGQKIKYTKPELWTFYTFCFRQTNIQNIFRKFILLKFVVKKFLDSPYKCYNYDVCSRKGSTNQKQKFMVIVQISKNNLSLTTKQNDEWLIFFVINQKDVWFRWVGGGGIFPWKVFWVSKFLEKCPRMMSVVLYFWRILITLKCFWRPRASSSDIFPKIFKENPPKIRNPPVGPHHRN